MSIGEFTVDLGVKADTYTLKDFAKTLENIPMSAIGAVSALTGMSFGFMELTKHTMSMANNLNMFSAQTGLSTQELQRWQNAAKQAGMTGDEVSSSFIGLQRTVASIQAGNVGGARAFAMLGLGPEDWADKSPAEIMMKLRGRAAVMDRSKFSYWLSQTGVDAGMMRLLTMPGGEFQRNMSFGSTLSNKNLDTMSEFQRSLALFSESITKAFAESMIPALIPAIGKLATAISDLINSPLAQWITKNFVEGAAEGATKVSNLVNDPVETLRSWNSSAYAVNRYLTMGLINKFRDSQLGGTNLNLEQHFHGVTNVNDGDKIGARELTHAAKQIPRSR